ncbi:hypothetical protein E2562_005896 [Oryza meyeriana var. granulata]|uniref:Uncharacterized protein n=1 Tax=Oryza meyeriana var. granulata TaxID=110450 RepID=A0A6G1DX83_9ORYZ|nr:hypothetical protein E2562_005896 [Oryza meyeriana var. granulata]
MTALATAREDGEGCPCCGRGSRRRGCGEGREAREGDLDSEGVGKGGRRVSAGGAAAALRRGS